MSFRPPHCPREDCPSITTGHRRWCFKGRYPRACDGRTVQRFLCLECHRTFSTQTFRVDYRLKKPQLIHDLIGPFVSKVTHRQAARIVGCTRKTIAHRLELLGGHCRDFHLRRLELARERGGLRGVFQLDELETFEHSRRLAPVTVPVLIERTSYFVVDLETAALPCRGRLSERNRERKKKREDEHGLRCSGSRAAVAKCMETLAKHHSRSGPVHVQTDKKSSYRTILARRFGARLAHERHSSIARRDYSNPLFPINHTLAMMRDGISRLVRRTWAASKLRAKLATHTWIWVVWRNYVRGITNWKPRRTPAMALGIELKRWKPSEICAWRVLPQR
jgi:transposase-like protein